MKLWTLQTRKVYETVKLSGIYQPDFERSEYIKFNKDLEPLYNFMLKSFNSVNHTNLHGLIFAFAKGVGNSISAIRDITEFQEMTKLKWPVVNTLWEHYRDKDMVIMELDYQDNFNPLFIDYNDYQFLMPPIAIFPPFNMSDSARIMNNIKRGIFEPSKFPGGFVQAHIPSIALKDIVNVHNMFFPE